MIRAEFEANLRDTINAYELQTGRTTDGETGVCSMIVLGAFRGANNLNFNSPPQTPRELWELEQSEGLVRASVHSPGVLVVDALKALLTQRKVSFHGIIAEGRMLTHKTHPVVVSHSVAIVADENLRPMGVVDSVAKWMFSPVDGSSPESDIGDAIAVVQGRFLPYIPRLHLVLDEAGADTLRRPGDLLPVDDRQRVTVGMAMAPGR